MPIHVLIAHLVVVLAPMAAALALVYAVAPRARAALHWPLVTIAVASATLVVWAGEAGSDLLDHVKTTGSAAEIAAASAHAKGSDAMAVAVFALAAMAVAAVWWLVRPGRQPSLRTKTGSAFLAIAAVAVLSTTVTTVLAALNAVWTHTSTTGG